MTVPQPRVAPDDRGSATVMVVAVVMMAMTLAIACAGLGTALVARHRAQSAADLAALAAAAAAQQDTSAGAACAQAAWTARANDAQLTSCSVRGRQARIQVRVPLPGAASRWGDAVARARAGPPSLLPAR